MYTKSCWQPASAYKSIHCRISHTPPTFSQPQAVLLRFDSICLRYSPYTTLPPPTPPPTVRGAGRDEDDGFTEVLCSQQSTSDDTASNLPGSGGMLGLLYSRWGRALEAAIRQVAHRGGLGPKAVASRIKHVEFKGVRSPGNSEPGTEGHVRQVLRWTVKDESEAKLRSGCRKLAKHATAEVWDTRSEAVSQIIQVVTTDPRLRAFFKTPPVLLDLRVVKQALYISGHGSAPKEYELIKHKRTVYCATQVLLATEDNPLNGVIEDLLQNTVHI
ncbi:uncharacterized protein FOMMEDRAFT_151960 [Fomitiporia mediterranea MF3/22]|uniref:uncharacterized protein n=1 Tax=Fomitiporia mediterranea (strain MF3/22) TaxID=694068 RepID=UPI00044077E7|nr:uncharacterized protein FOMMEDRAFT_151960 [Fomitiporia mediterranea MF3/22]EJD06662.1 hypothetical protein FOMMEDRAFT_151960 [Fomitiporia mediterranea MF3/22]